MCLVDSAIFWWCPDRKGWRRLTHCFLSVKETKGDPFFLKELCVSLGERRAETVNQNGTERTNVSIYLSCLLTRLVYLLSRKAPSNNFCECNCYVTHLVAIEIYDSMFYSHPACDFFLPKQHTSPLFSLGPEWSSCAGLQNKIKCGCSFVLSLVSPGVRTGSAKHGRSWSLGINLAASVLMYYTSGERRTVISSLLLINEQTFEMCIYKRYSKLGCDLGMEGDLGEKARSCSAVPWKRPWQHLIFFHFAFYFWGKVTAILG